MEHFFPKKQYIAISNDVFFSLTGPNVYGGNDYPDIAIGYQVLQKEVRINKTENPNSIRASFSGEYPTLAT